jgi:hypothetical protein
VTAVESVRHLAETARAIVALNGCANRINVLHKDGRYLSVEGQSSSGAKPMHYDMPSPADLLAFEVSCVLHASVHHVVMVASGITEPDRSTNTLRQATASEAPAQFETVRGVAHLRGAVQNYQHHEAFDQRPDPRSALHTE